MYNSTDVITCHCDQPDIEYLDSRYVDHWVCRKCHHFGGCRYPSDTNNTKQIVRYPAMNQCNNEHDIQHLEDKLDDFRNAVHDKVLSYGSLTKGIGIGLLIAVIIMFLIIALGIFNFNPIVQQGGGAQAAPTAPSEPPASPFPALP